MGPELLAGIAVAATGVTKEAFGALIQGTLEAAGQELAKELGEKALAAVRRWKAEKGFKQLCERGKQIRKVKTIWQVERELDLVKFYYPSKIKSSVEAPRVVNQLSDFPSEGNIIVRGTVGQGKSIFLRYLAARELALGEKVPVFVELRRLGSTRVVEAVYDELRNLGLTEAGSEVFEFFANSGRIALLLDGFDELEEEQVSRVIGELESLAVTFPSLRIVITSRPDAAVEHSAHFRVFDLAPLAPGEFARVVERIAHDERLAEEIVTGVKRAHHSIAALLTTPLMVALLVVQFRVGNGVPERRDAPEHRDLPFHDLLPVMGNEHPVLLAAAEQLGVSLRASLQKRRQAVHVVEERKGLLDI